MRIKNVKKSSGKPKKISPDGFVAIIGCYAQLKTPGNFLRSQGWMLCWVLRKNSDLSNYLDGFAANQEAKVYGL